MSDADVVLENYVYIVSEGGDRPKPRIKPKDQALAAELFKRCPDHDQITKILEWAIDHEFWGDKVITTFARFAGAAETISEQMCRKCSEGELPSSMFRRFYIPATEHETYAAYVAECKANDLEPESEAHFDEVHMPPESRKSFAELAAEMGLADKFERRKKEIAA